MSAFKPVVNSVRDAVVKVGSMVIKIQQADQWYDSKAYGAFVPDTRNIIISMEAPKSVPIHELAHAFEEVFGFEDISEQTITLVEAAVSMFIIDNPEYCRALIDDIAGKASRKK